MAAAASTPSPSAPAASWRAWEKSTKCALCIIPDESLWPSIQSIRGKHDAHATRWMPHINILFPFVTADQLADTAHVLAAQLASFAPFEICFDDVSLFSHSAKSHTFWLSPRTASGVDIAEIHRAAANLFPICDDSSSRKTGFSPHLTLGQVKGHTPDKAMLKALWPGGTFTCSRLFILARSTFDDPFHVRHVVPLGGGSCASGDWLYTADCDTYWHDVATGETRMRMP